MAEKNKKIDIKEKIEQETSREDLNIFSKIIAPLKILINIHIKVAKNELKRDAGRYFSAMVTVFLGIIGLIVFLLFSNVCIVFLFNELLYSKIIAPNWSMFFSILSVTVLNLIIALFLFLVGNVQFKKPFLHETRTLIKDSIKELKVNK